MKTLLLISLTLVFSLSVFGQNDSSADDIVSYTKVGQEMPSINVKDLKGHAFNTKDLKGKVIFVNFWATWCPPCLSEMPRLEKEIWQKYKSPNFVMMTIAREQSEQEITEFKDKHKFTFPMATDPDREVFKLFGNGGIPRSYVIGTDGKILFQTVGYDSDEFDKMKKIIEKELEKADKSN